MDIETLTDISNNINKYTSGIKKATDTAYKEIAKDYNITKDMPQDTIYAINSMIKYLITSEVEMVISKNAIEASLNKDFGIKY